MGKCHTDLGDASVCRCLALRSGNPARDDAQECTHACVAPGLAAAPTLSLRVPPDQWTPATTRSSAGATCGASLRYALPFPFQCGPTTMGLLVMRMVEGTPNYGYLDGSDVVLVDSLRDERCRIFPATRNEELGRNGGVQLNLKSPLIGGFVPIGAQAVNGTPHPHAGTGFAVCQAHIFPSFEQGGFSWRDPQREDLNETYALSFDGTTFKTERVATFTQQPGRPLELGDTGWALLVSGITNAIPDGNDLLFPVPAVRIDRTATAVGVARWARVAGSAWTAVDFEPVATSEGDQTAGCGPGTRRSIEACPWMEPSLVRDASGHLLFSARGADAFEAADNRSGFCVQVWRGKPVGRSQRCRWTVALLQHDVGHNSPVTINSTGNIAYLVSSPYNRDLLPESDATGRGREKLVMWPLEHQRERAAGEANEPSSTQQTSGDEQWFNLRDPVLVRDCLQSFGQPPQFPKRCGAAQVVGDDGKADPPEKWMVDHANGVVCRLANGWRAVLAYRICHSPRYRPSSVREPSEHSGAYVVDTGLVGSAIEGDYGGLTPWRFAADGLAPWGGPRANRSLGCRL